MHTLLHRTFAAVVFDLDGVLTDTASRHREAWARLFDEELPRLSPGTGAFTPDDYRRYVDGRSREEGIRTLLAARGVPAEELTFELVGRLARRKQSLFEASLEERAIALLPGASALLHRLRSTGVRVGVATSSKNAARIIEQTGLGPLLDARVDGTDAAALGLPSKPDPALFRETCRRLGVVACDAVLVEDSEAGLLAAAAAGFGFALGIGSGPSRTAALRRAGADAVVTGLDVVRVTATGGLASVGVIDEWVLRFDGSDTAAETTRETLCTVANGFWGTRGCTEEAVSGPGHRPGTYLAGVYDDVEDSAVHTEEIVNLPNWLPLLVRPAGADWLRPGTGRSDVRQELDVRQGVFRRTVTISDADGRVTTLRFQRFLSLADCRTGAQRLTVVAHNWSGRATIRSGIDAGVVNTSPDIPGPARRRHLRVHEHRPLSADSTVVAAQTASTGVVFALAERTRLFRNEVDVTPAGRFGRDAGLAFHDFEVDIVPGEPLVIEKTVAIATSRDRASDAPATAAAARVSRTPSFSSALAAHAEEWEALWSLFAVEIRPGGRHSLEVNVNTFHVLQTLCGADDDRDAGVPARGLHGEAYGGHVFWDELFVHPLLTLRRPDLTRALLAYRARRLPEARYAAVASGHAGARFPWRSATSGEDVTPDRLLNPLTGRWMPDHSALQRHVGLAVAYSAWQFYETTGDADYLAEQGSELIVGVARYFASLAEWDAPSSRYRISGVMGPDEFHDGPVDAPGTGLTDNVYTNVMTAWCLLHAVDAVRLVSARPDPTARDALGVTPDELDRWAHIASRLRIVFNADGTLSQFDGYDDLEPIDLDAFRSRYPTAGRLDLVLNARGDTTNRYQVSKQPDCLMLLYLLSAEELRDLLAHLGYRLDRDAVVRTVARYSRDSSYGSTLSNVVHSWLEARVDRGTSWRFLERCLRSDLADIQGGTTQHGIHVAAMAGSVDLLVRCYAGLEARAGMLWFHPLLPGELRSLRFTVMYRAHRLQVAITPRTVRIESAPGAAEPIRLMVEGRQAVLRTGQSRTFRL
ncbi:HAD-IA family hydrolase [Leifsonia poae]|uniref:HAD-IA family hydrolase n=1 Tax=Leifsonia poae TaxID=110933 RepID=UPI003D690FC2